jgi:hypothetical protein
MGFSGGAGGEPVDPVIESVVAENPIVTSFPTTVTFAAVVSDPQGVEDIASGDLFLVNEHLASFEATGEPGHYRAAVALNDAANWPQQGFVVLTAWFYDQAGHSAEASPTIKIEPTGCSQQPDAASCRDCFCDADPAGCASYTQREYEHLYCGSTCRQDCAAFCQTVDDGNPDPSLIMGFCAACVPSGDDQDAFESSCLADIPDCFGFLVDLGNCPP